MRYENLFTRAARMVWRKPWLWLLAFLAGEAYAGGGGSGGGGTGFNPNPGGSSANLQPPDLGWVPNWIGDRIGLLLAVGAGLLLLWLVLFLLSCVASGALVSTVAALDRGEAVSFGPAWGMGTRTFWRVLGFKLFSALLVWLSILVLLPAPIVGVAVGGGNGVIKGLLLDLPILVVVWFWIVLVQALATFGLRALVLDGAGPVRAYYAAWALLRRRFTRIALTWVFFIAVGIGVGIPVQIVLSVFSLPVEAPAVSAVSAGNWSQALSAALVALALITPIALAVGSAVGAYFSAAWTVAYRRFDVEGEIPEPPALAA